MPKTDHNGYTITTQHTLWDGEIKYRYLITKLSPNLTHTWSEWEYDNAYDAQCAAESEIDSWLHERSRA